MTKNVCYKIAGTFMLASALVQLYQGHIAITLAQLGAAWLFFQAEDD